MVSKEELTEMGLEDFRIFVGFLWNHLGLPKPTPLQLNIAHYLQYGPDLSMIQAFRGAAKTWLTGAYVGWNLLWRPEMKIMLVSASQRHADGLSLFIKGMFEEIDIMQHLADGRRWANDQFDMRNIPFDPTPSVKSIGLKGQLTGSRAHLIIPDDIEVPANSLTDHMKEDTRERTKEFRSVLHPRGKMKWLGTPQVEDSLYNELPRLGYDLQIWPSRVPTSKDEYLKEFVTLGEEGEIVERVQRCALAPMIQRMMDDPSIARLTPTEPSRFDEKDLASREIEYGRSGFQLQYMLNTQAAAAEIHPLKLRNLIVDSVDHDMAHIKYVWSNIGDNSMKNGPSGFEGDKCYYPVWRSSDLAEFTGCVMAIDPSGKGKDETAYAIMKQLYGYLFLVEVGGFLDGFGEVTLTNLAERGAYWGVSDVVVEKNYGGGMFSSLLFPKMELAGCKAQIHDPIAGGVVKEFRICDTLEPLTGSHRLIVDQNVLESDINEAVSRGTNAYSFIHQYTRMIKEKGAIAHEDRLEAVQMAASFFEDRVRIGANKGVERHRNKLLNQEIRSWFKEVPGKSVTLGLERLRRARRRNKQGKSTIWRNKPKGVR